MVLCKLKPQLPLNKGELMEVIVINSHFDDSSVTVVQMIFRYPSPDTRERGLEYSMAADSARHFVFDDKEITE